MKVIYYDVLNVMLIVEVQYPDLCFLRRYVVAPFELQHLDLYVLGLIADREIERESYLIRRVVSAHHTHTHFVSE